MKKVIIAVALVALVLLFHNSASASMSQDVGDIVFETTGWIIGKQAVNIPFQADVAPYTYLVILSDLSEATTFGFNFLYLSITTATGPVDSIFGPGQFQFTATPGDTYWVNVIGEGGGTFGAGLFGVEITAVPIPASILLFGSGILSMVFFRRRKH